MKNQCLRGADIGNSAPILKAIPLWHPSIGGSCANQLALTRFSHLLLEPTYLSLQKIGNAIRIVSIPTFLVCSTAHHDQNLCTNG
jgi:hypothetical protein